MGEVLGFDNILSGDDFMSDAGAPADYGRIASKESKLDEFLGEHSTEVDADSFFGDDTDEDDGELRIPKSQTKAAGEPEDDEDSPEGVGSGAENDDIQGQEEDTPLEDDEDSPSPDDISVFSSMTAYLKEEGVFSDLDEELLNGVKTSEDFKEVLNEVVKKSLDAETLRVKEALDAGIEPDVIRQYENTLKFLEQEVSEDILREETPEADNLRKRLIYSDYRNRGWDDAKARKAVEKVYNLGMEIDEAIDALENNRQFFKGKYTEEVSSAQATAKAEEEALRKEIQAVEEEISGLNEYQGIKLPKQTRQKIVDNLIKPVHKDEQGNLYSAIQKYEMENPKEFRKNLGIIFTLTNGFKNFDGLVKDKVRGTRSKAVKEIAHALSSAQRGGSKLSHMGGGEDFDLALDGDDFVLDI